MSFKAVTFDRKKSVFVKTLKKRVDNYFKDNKISKHANFNMFLKTILLIFYFISDLILVLYIFNALLITYFMVCHGIWNGRNWNVSNARCQSWCLFEK